jgi:hypothetical protein
MAIVGVRVRLVIGTFQGSSLDVSLGGFLFQRALR